MLSKNLQRQINYTLVVLSVIVICASLVMLCDLHNGILILAGWVGAYLFQGILLKSFRSAFNHHHHRCLHTLYRSSVNSMTSYGCAYGFTSVIFRIDFNRIRVYTIFFATAIHVVAYTFFEAERITTWTPWRFPPPGRKREQRTRGGGKS